MPIKEIIFKSSYGIVRLLMPHGTDQSYQIYINDYFQGMLFIRDGKWLTNLNDLSKLKQTDIEKLIDIVIEKNKN